MKRARACLLACLLAPTAIAACSSSSPTSSQVDGGPDATTEAGSEAGGEASGPEATVESGSEASNDASKDASDASDSAADATHDALVDSAPEAQSEAEAGPPAPTAVVNDAPAATALVTDGTDLYWIDSVSGTGRVMKVPVAGGTEVTLATSAAVTERIALDSTNVYFTDDDDVVWQVPKAGGTALQLATSDAFVPLAVAGGAVYYGAGGGVSKVAVNTDGGAEADAGTSLATSGDPVDLVVVAGDVFWANPTQGLLEYVPASTGGTPATLLGPDPEAGTGEFVSTTGAQDLTTDGTSLYWNRAPSGSVPGAIMTIPVGGGFPSVVVNIGIDTPFSVVTDGSSVYYLDFGATSSLVRVAIGGGSPDVLTTSDLGAAGIAGTPGPTVAVDSTRVYWLDPPQILSLPK